MENTWFKKLTMALIWVIIIAFAILLIKRFTQANKNEINLDQTKDNWAKMMLILNSVDKDYVDAIDYEKVTEELLPDIMSKLDPHSVYLPPQELKDAEESLQGGFDGIGIQFTVPNDTAVVSNVIVGGPSEKAGLLSGDRILMVNDVSIAGVKMPQDSMVLLMKGRKGTKVDVSIKRNGEDKPIPFTIIRDKIPVKSVDVAFMINDTTGYIKLSKFAKTSYSEFLESSLKLREKGMKKLIFDLRDNTGGYLDQAMLLSNEFLQKGDLVVYMEGKNRPRQDLFADGKGGCRDIELAVLINEGSASSSEIFAGAMQDNDRATIYGLRSFGKGLVQEPIYFSDGSGIRLTVARFYTPTGRSIQKPYSPDYEYDIIHRYEHGEMTNVDSIRVNDSLKYITPKGKIVYGGGGIIPDVFVPLDTVGVTDFMIKCNRQGLQNKFANEISDEYRVQMRNIKDMASLNKFLDGLSLEKRFLAYTKDKGVVPEGNQWQISGNIIMIQVRALIGRYTPMDDNAFYPIYLQTDNVIKKVLENKPIGR
ncbi:MAG: S41 family peptidase [Bacteroidales bacterium]|nr:S41 family peptidase [Bacteroidales bacterium]MDD4669853.1 S41 family peptidase [Bacteroidales bacterium]